MALSTPRHEKFWTPSVKASILRQVEAYRREVGARLRALREARNWSQEDAAHEVGVVSATWGRWERGVVAPYESNWKRIAEVFGEEAAREARGRPPAPLGLGNGDGNGNGQESLDVRIAALAKLVKGLDEQLRLLRAESAARDAEALKRIEEGFRTIRESRRRRPG